MTHGPRRGDPIPLVIQAADGPTVVMHSPEEYAALWQGVDKAASEALGRTNKRRNT